MDRTLKLQPWGISEDDDQILEREATPDARPKLRVVMQLKRNFSGYWDTQVKVLHTQFGYGEVGSTGWKLITTKSKTTAKRKIVQWTKHHWPQIARIRERR